MPGTVGTAGIAGFVAAITVAAATAGAASVVSQRAAAAADAAALAAADAASGASTGVPCERAAQVAEAHGAGVDACSLDALVATVSVSVPWGVFTAAARARAGPPG